VRALRDSFSDIVDMIDSDKMLLRPFSLLPVQVVQGETWLVDYDVKTWEIYAILYMEPKENDLWISFSIAYQLRWLEQARQDSKGKWWLMNGRSIRTPLNKWGRSKGYFIFFKPSEITFFHPTQLPK